MNLVRPYQVMKEIWAESEPEADLSRSDERMQPVSPLLPGWWGLWLLSNGLAAVTVVMPMDPGKLALYTFLTDFVDIPLCFVTLLLVRAIDRRPAEKRALPARPFKQKARAFL